MNWDVCRIQAVETIKKVSADNGISIRKAITHVSKELDMPTSTLKKWVYPGDTTGTKNGPSKKYTVADQISGAISVDPVTGELIVGKDIFPKQIICTFLSINAALEQLPGPQAMKLIDLIKGYCDGKRAELKRGRR